MKDIEAPSFNTICPHCWGSGKIKAMQRAMTYDAGSIRVHDIEVKCIYCNGTGRKDDR